MNVGDAGEVRCEKDAVASSLPEGMQVLHLEQMDEGFLVQWAAVESADTLFITFKGTDNPTDVIMTVGYAQRDDKPHALSVASSMQTALDNKGGRAETTVCGRCHKSLEQCHSLQDQVVTKKIFGRQHVQCTLAALAKNHEK